MMNKFARIAKNRALVNQAKRSFSTQVGAENKSSSAPLVALTALGFLGVAYVSTQKRPGYNQTTMDYAAPERKVAVKTGTKNN